MTFSADHFLSQSLQKRRDQNALRSLVSNSQLIDFCSNDYLGFARSINLRNAIKKECLSFESISNGSTGSRLLAGNTAYIENLEREIARFHEAESGLIFNSGYDANVGLFSSIGQKGSFIIYDELIHASVHDGIKMSSASSYPFRHNDMNHLEERLKIVNGDVFVAVESIYSMDGDEAKLQEVSALCEKYKANLIVDEAHATGVTHNQGKGLVQKYSLQKNVFARVHTFGKAMGCHGAIILSANLLHDYLINFSRSFIYTTALPMHSLVSINQAYKLLALSRDKVLRLQQLIAYFRKTLALYKNIQLVDSESSIQGLIVSGNAEIKALACHLQGAGLDIRAILSPTVPKGQERLRICLHAFNTENEIDQIAKEVKRFFEKNA